MSTPYYQEVTVVGAGTMGNGIAQTFAAAGTKVNLVDVNAEALAKGLATIEKSLGRFVKKEKLTQAQADEVFGRITGHGQLSAAAGSALVVEAVVEKLEVKRAIFAELDSLCGPDAILATNTSSISVTEIAAATSRPDKVIGMHFMNPVPLMKLVEIVRAQETSDETVRVINECSLALGKTPVETDDYPGFVSNRVLMPMINEAVYCLMEGVATADGIDTVMKLGMNHPMGPLALADLIGLDVCLDIMNVLYDGFGDSKYRPCPLLRRMVAAGNLGRKAGKGFYDYQ
ncbi:MAG: 3-hydroxybutyryl-CoA dehydrogenase [Planctomycetota bacterium]|nr:3-hydroxybutyryl-CoA dehydrogenase [Planctomycetota bacterium]